MDPNIRKRNELLAQKVIKGLESRNMTGYYAENREAALKKALELIPEGGSVTMGGAMSAHEIGLVKAVKSGKYTFIDRLSTNDPEEQRALILQAYDADVYLASPNAMTEDGVLVNIDGNSNRVSAIAYGPKKVLFIAGMNKVCSDVDGAMKRARNVAAPINNQRFDNSTPCTKTGACADCKSPDTICCQFLITRYSRHKDRIHVILVNDNLGF
ncbi:MAG: lactate utilization protein [Lachnospiraceae bacterium]|nr:lactate utilization protein [Lachnospiraceae bacterium]